MEIGALGLEEVLDDLHDAVYVLDRDRRIVLWNRAAERITGFERQEVLGRRCRDGVLVHVDADGCQMCDDNCPASAVMSEARARQAEVYLRHKHGHRVPIQVRATPLRDASGEVVGAIEVFSDNTVDRWRRERIDDLERSALLDHLTQMPNRRALDEELAAREARLNRYGRVYGLLMIDIDHFKQVNDTWGHEVGDKLLRMVARTLSATTRGGDQVGRWGGEEFLAILSAESREALLTTGQRYLAMVRQSSMPGPEGPLTVTVSIGAALATAWDVVDDVVRAADERLYEAKRAGRDRIC